jgi:hypothetical protein
VNLSGTAVDDRRRAVRWPLVVPLPGRLIALVVVGVVAGGFILYRGLTADGQDRVVYTFFGALALVGALIICVAWWRGTRRR